jgi:hypothetical protein
MSSQQIYYSFLFFQFLPAGRINAGLLTLNSQGFPEDFRYTLCPDINTMQEILFGDNLENWLILSSTKQLFNDFSLSPGILFSNYSGELELPDSIKCPTVFIPKEEPSKGIQSQVNNEEAYRAFELTGIIPDEIFTRIEHALKALHLK